MEEIKFIENDVLAVGVSDDEGGYIMWQRGLTEEVGSDHGVYFEFDDQINGGYNNVLNGKVTQTEVLISLDNGSTKVFQLPKGFSQHSELESALKEVYLGFEQKIEFSI